MGFKTLLLGEEKDKAEMEWVARIPEPTVIWGDVHLRLTCIDYYGYQQDPFSSSVGGMIYILKIS